MNTPMHFSLDEKTMYQMGLGHGTAHSAASYVPETSSTAVLTNQLLEMLNPPSTSDDKNKFRFNDLMTPHYQKQEEMMEKLDRLTSMVTNFIENQQSMNEFILDRLLKESNATPPALDSSVLEKDQAEKQQQSVFESIVSTLPEEPHQILDTISEITQPMLSAALLPVASSSSLQSTSSALVPSEPVQMDSKMSVRDFLKSNLEAIKRDHEDDEENDEEGSQNMSMEEFNKFRVRNPPKKYKRSVNTCYPPAGTSSNTAVNEEPTSSTASHVPPEIQVETLDFNHASSFSTSSHQIAVPAVQRLTEPSIDLALMQQHIYQNPGPFSLNGQPILTSHQPHVSLVPHDLKFHQDVMENVWKQPHSDSHTSGIAQIVNDAHLSLDHTHTQNNFLHFTGSNEPHPKSAFVPAMAQYNKDRRC